MSLAEAPEPWARPRTQQDRDTVYTADIDAEALRRSWAKVMTREAEFASFFYSHVFVSAPETRDMFPVSMSNQRDKFVTALGSWVAAIDRVDETLATIRQMGRDHRRFSVVPAHYDVVGASLLAGLQHFLRDEWNDGLAADWAAAYGVFAKLMVAAASSPRTSRLRGGRRRWSRSTGAPSTSAS